MKKAFDIILVMPYPFTDHPSFPEGILANVLKAEGFRVGVIDSPHWQDPREFTRLGRPQLFFAIVPGPVDSIIMNFTPTGKRRREDLYQMDGNAYFAGLPPGVGARVRPDRSVITLANQIRKAWKDIEIVAGGMETSQRIAAHFDYQQQRIRRSILLDARLDLAVSGMGEIQIVEIARAAASGTPLREMKIPGTAVNLPDPPGDAEWIELPGHEDILNSPDLLLQSYRERMRAGMQGKGTRQRHGDRWIVKYPDPPYTSRDLDRIYNLEYSRTHLSSISMSPALTMNLFSITSHRGCLGRCAFCAVRGHQGGHVVSRSSESIIREVVEMQRHARWRGIVTDLGGATAEMYGMDEDANPVHPPYLELLRRLRNREDIRKVFVSSGVRFDLMLKYPELLEEIMRHHSGRFLRVAPEHTHDEVLSIMGKPSLSRFREFCRLFSQINRGLKRRVELAAYVVIGHPGESDHHVRGMKATLRNLGVDRVDAQIFTPAPGLLSTAMYVAGSDLRGKTLPVCRESRLLDRRKESVYPR